MKTTKETIWLVMSRDRGIIAASKNEAVAEKTAREWELNERMGGGNPSIWIEEIELI
jgi:hypothetical protein